MTVPYIQVELDAMERVPDAARLAGIPEHQLGWGLARLWRDCWRTKSDRVTAEKLEAFFGTDGTRVGRALVAFNFSEAMADGTFRVRGAERYLRISEARAAAGRARASTAKRTNKGRMRTSASKRPAIAGEVLDGCSAIAQQPSSKEPALTASSEQHSASIEETQNLAGADAPRGEQEALPGIGPEKRAPLRRQLSDALVAEFELQRGPGHKFTSRDGKALDGILDAAQKANPGDPIGEARKRYRYGLTRSFNGISEIHELETHWNKQVPPKSQGPPARLPLDLRSKFPDQSQARLMSVNEALERQHG